MRRWWPGPLTLILHAKGGGTLGVRIPKHKVALDLLRAAGPLMTTSANLHGKDPAMTAERGGRAAGRDGGARRRQGAGRDGVDRARPDRPRAARAARRRDLDAGAPGPAAVSRGLTQASIQLDGHAQSPRCPFGPSTGSIPTSPT